MTITRNFTGADFFTTAYIRLYEHWVITNSYFEQKRAVAAALFALLFWPQF